MMDTKDIERLRKASGEIQSDDPLVSFLYSLMRDHVTPGIVEKLTLESAEIFTGTTRYTNGFLALYAIDIAKRLKG